MTASSPHDAASRIAAFLEQAEAERCAEPPSDYVPWTEGEPLWVFGYGSLMWKPDFPYDWHGLGLVRGYHRRFCVYSMHYRGTPESPGLVLGLARGGACQGMAYRVPADSVRGTLRYLWRREMISRVYAPKLVQVRVNGAARRAVTFVAVPSHTQYARLHDLSEMAALICCGHGAAGPNRDYLFNTVRHLRELGIVDQQLTALETIVRDRLADIGASDQATDQAHRE